MPDQAGPAQPPDPRAAGGSGELEDYPLERVPRSARYPWLNVAVQRFGQLSDVAQFLLGAVLGAGLSFWGAFWAFTLGAVFLELVCVLVGIIGVREGLSTTLLSRWTGFGRYGSVVIGVAITVSMFGWFGIQTAVLAQGLHAIITAVPVWAWCLLSGLLITALVLRGFRAMGWTAFVTVPAFLGLAGWAMTVQVSRHDVGDLLASPPFGAPMSVATGATIVAGSYIAGAVVTADMTRFNRGVGDVVKQTVIGVTLGEYVIGLAGVLLAYAVKSSDVVAIITASSGAVGVVVLIASTLKINNWNLYSCTLGIISAVESVTGIRLSRLRVTVAVGVLGSIAAAAGILGAFAGFLTLLGVLLPPVAGIMVAEYFVVRRWRPDLDASRRVGRLPDTEPAWVPASIAIWLAAAAVGWLSNHFQWWGIPSVNSLLLAGIGYLAAGSLGLIRGHGEIRFRQPDSPAAAAEPGP